MVTKTTYGKLSYVFLSALLPLGTRGNIEAIKKIQALSTKQELHLFMGMIKYLSQFIPSMSDLTSNPRKTPEKGCSFSVDG